MSRRFPQSIVASVVCAAAACAALAQESPQREWLARDAELQELPLPEPAAPAGEPQAFGPAEPGIGNDDVLAMAGAEFGDATIVAAIQANETRFDVSPRALVALKAAGVSERVIEAMLAAETAKRETAAVTLEAEARPEAEGAAAALQASPEALQLQLLAQMIERLAVAQEAAAAPAPAGRAADIDLPLADDRSPRAWVARGAAREALPPTIAEVAFTDERNLGGNALRTLQGLAGKALAFANPALGIASTLGGFLRPSDDARTAVWALAGGTAGRSLTEDTVFEVEFGNVPGVNPDEYRPAIVRLVPTTDNYRLVAAARTNGANATPDGPIVEEPVATEIRRIGRGHYRVAPGAALDGGEYALVLRPVVKRERGRRRNSESSLGELLGSGTSQILYLTWDFSVPT